ncbi:hypothetical protein JD844_033086 [Phrynosoma platyrhinos]|uniref:Cyclin-like domain-containing protein n=1 Tax=Phrynosoma platyrhinos TaxID=52577 RepID=A0ABQ7T635_PHRPL|nr:hypothetical protein JD844_033086 [Phrynosoma platyrhinos]
MLLSSKGEEKEQAGRRDALSVITELRANQNAPQRAILRELSENGQCLRPCVQGPAIVRHLSGSENVCPATGKSVLPTCLSSKQNFTVYIDDVEERSRCSYMAVEEVEPSMCEVETSELKPSLHLLLNFSTGSPMSVDKSLQSQNEDLHDTKEDVLSVVEYAEDIHHYLREAEVKYRPKPCYMRKQPDITSGMRAVLVDWLVEVGEEYKLQTETLYLAVNYLDRKYEEIYPPEVEEFVYITDDTYTKKQLLRMEHLLLKVLAFDLTVPTTNQFLLQYLQRHGVSLKTENFARPETLAVFTGYSLSEIVPCLSDLHRTCLEAPHRQQQAIREKYKLTKYMQVSLLDPPAVLPLQ